MKQKLTLLLLALFTAVGAWATDVTVGFSDGIFYQNSTKNVSYTSRPGEDTWSSYWESNGTPKVTLQGSSAWNLRNDNFYGTTYTITVPSGYHITGYSITPSALPNSSANLTHSGCSAKAFTVDMANTISNLYTTSVTFTLSDQVTASAFTISVEENDPLDQVFYLLNVAGGYVNSNYSYSATTSGATKFRVAQGTGDYSAYYTIFNCTTGQYVNFTGTTNGTENVLTNSDVISENSYWTLTTGGSDGYYPGHYNLTPKGGSGVSWNFFGGNSAGAVIGLWISSQNGYWKFVVEECDFGDYAYTIVNARNSLTAASAEATSITTIGKAGLAYSSVDGKQQFAFVYSSYGKCYLYNVGTNKFVSKDGSLSEYPSDAITLEVSGSWQYPWVIKFDNSHYINIDGYNSLEISSWGNGNSFDKESEYDAGNMFKTLDRVAYDLSTAESKLVANVTYQIVYNGSNSISAVVDGTEIGATLSLPNVLKRGYIENYTFYSDAECTNEITTVPSGGDVTVYVKAVLSGECPITFSTEESPVWYVLQGKPGTTDSKNRNMYSDGSVVRGSLDLPITTSHQWAFIGNPFVFKLKNGNGTYVTPSGTSGNNVALDETGANFGLYKNAAGSDNHIAMAVYDGTNQNVLNYHNGTATNMTSYVGTGATFNNGTISGLSSAFFYPYEYYEKAITDYYTTYVGPGLLNCGKVGYPSTVDGAYTTLVEYCTTNFGVSPTYNATTLSGLIENFHNLTSAPIIMPTDGKAYSIANYAKDGTLRYLYNNSGNIDLTTESSITDDYKFVCHIKDGKFIFAMNNGNYLIWRGSTGSGQTALATAIDGSYPLTIQNFSKEPSNSNNTATEEEAFGKLQIIGLRTAPSTTSSLIVRTSANPAVFDQANATNFFNSNFSSAWVITEVDYYNKVTLTSDGTDAYASIYLPFAATIPSGVTAYAVTDQNGTSAHMEAIVTGGTLPKETAAILKKAGLDSNETIYLSPAEEAGSNPTTPYDGFSGTVETKTVESLGTGNTYVLANGGEGLGLYNYTGTNLAKGKAYLFVPGSSVKGYISFDFDDDATGLERVQDVQDVQGAIYNVAGQRLNKIQKGINIVNGKKILK